MEYVKVKDQPHLARDPHTNNIVNTNKSEYEEYLARKKAKLSESQRVRELESDVEMIRNDLDIIKNLLHELVKGSN